MEEAERSATEIVTDFVRRAIHDGRLMPGDRVVEREIGRELNIGRSVVREAIHGLVRQGILTRNRQQSPRVKLLSKEEKLSLLEVWRALGPLIFRLAAERIRIRRNRDLVVSAFERLRSGLAGAPGHRDLSSSGDYIDTIVAVADNPFASRAIEAMNFHLFNASFGPLPPDRSAEYLEWVDAIEQALLESDPTEVEALYGRFIDFIISMAQRG